MDRDALGVSNSIRRLVEMKRNGAADVECEHLSSVQIYSSAGIVIGRSWFWIFLFLPHFFRFQISFWLLWAALSHTPRIVEDYRHNFSPSTCSSGCIRFRRTWPLFETAPLSAPHSNLSVGQWGEKMVHCCFRLVLKVKDEHNAVRTGVKCRPQRGGPAKFFRVIEADGSDIRHRTDRRVRVDGLGQSLVPSTCHCAAKSVLFWMKFNFDWNDDVVTCRFDFDQSAGSWPIVFLTSEPPWSIWF